MAVDAGSARARKPVGAARFFWMWLIAATAVSVGGNVVHAVLCAPVGRVPLAAAAAVVPPTVLLGSTHSVGLLVAARRVNAAYWCALIMTFALAVCAFVLSFDALRELAIALGMPADRAWLWPVAIDVSIANSTVALLSLTPPRTADDVRTAESPPATKRPACVRSSSRPSRVETPPVDRSAQRTMQAPPGPIDPAAAARWAVVAEKLVGTGVTSKEPALVATVLAEHAAGVSRGAIGRRLAIHHETVARIVTGAKSIAD